MPRDPMHDKSGSVDQEVPAAAARVLRAYGIDCATRAEQRARAGVLDRMGAFAPCEREALDLAGLLGEEVHHD